MPSHAIAVPRPTSSSSARGPAIPPSTHRCHPDPPIRPAAPAVGGLVGRDAELHTIRRFLTVPDGPTVLLLAGEAGIGKTALWSAALQLATQIGQRPLIARAHQEQMESASGIHDFADGLRMTPAPDEPPTVRRGAWLRHVLHDLTGQSPVLLAVDDLQWLDTATTRALQYALPRLDDRRVRLLATVRSWGPDGTAPPPALPVPTQQLHIGPLPRRDISRVLANVGTVVSRPEAERLHAMSGGNPLFAIEFARGGWARSDLDAPASAMAALTDRIRGLSRPALAVATCIAMTGPTPLHAVAEAAAIEDQDAAIREGVAVGVIRVDEDFVVHLTHPLLATATAALTNALDRRDIHRHLADLVEDPQRRALHLARGVAEPDEQMAQELEDAASTAAARGDYDVAAELYASASRLTLSGRDRVRRELAAVPSRAAAGQTHDALQLLDDILQHQLPAGLQIEAVTLRAFLDFGDSERFLTHALRTAPTNMRGPLLDLLGLRVGWYCGQLHRGMTYAAEALELARGQDDEQLVMFAAMNLSTLALLSGAPRRELMEHALEMGDERAPWALGRWPRVFLGRHCLWNGDLEEARAHFERMEVVAVETGSEFQRPYRQYDRAMLELAAGDLATAAAATEDGVEAALCAGNAQVMSWLDFPRGLVDAHRGHAKAAEASAKRLDEYATIYAEPPRAAMAAVVRGTSAAAEAQWSAALDHFDRAVRLLHGLGYRHPGFIPALPGALEAAAALGDADRCNELALLLEQQEAALDAPWVTAQAEHARGVAQLVADNPGRAVAHLARASTLLEDLGFGLDAARVRLTLAKARIRDRQRCQARDDLERCGWLFDEVAAPGWAAQAANLATRAGHVDGDLTATEQQVAELVAEGLKNREVATRMFVSVSTIEAHLTRVYRKLDLRGRSDLVALLRGGATGLVIAEAT